MTVTVYYDITRERPLNDRNLTSQNASVKTMYALARHIYVQRPRAI